MTRILYPNFLFCLLPFAGAEEWATKFLSEFIPEKFDAPCTTLPAAGPIPDEYLVPPFHGYNSRDLVCHVSGLVPAGAERIIALTPAYLWDHETQQYLGGRAEIDGRAAVVSTMKLGCCGDCQKPTLKYAYYDLAILALHEIGHTLGLNHCRNRHCVMVWNGYNEPDRKSVV